MGIKNSNTGGAGSQMYQAQSLLKNSIMKANVKSYKKGSAGGEGKSLLGRLCGSAFSGMLYVLSLIVIVAIVFFLM